jgi:hypothetical protein
MRTSSADLQRLRTGPLRMWRSSTEKRVPRRRYLRHRRYLRGVEPESSRDPPIKVGTRQRGRVNSAYYLRSQP